MLTNTPAGLDVISKSGFDFVCIDLEHSSISYEDLNSLLIILDKNKVDSFVRVSSNNQTEINDELGSVGVNAHHMFPKASFPLLRGYKENIILLTPTQHYNEAHLAGSTRYINPEYQIRCLLQKIKSVERSYDNDDGFYSKEDLVDVLNSGYRTDIFSTDNEFDQISNKLIDLTSTLENS